MTSIIEPGSPGGGAALLGRGPSRPGGRLRPGGAAPPTSLPMLACLLSLLCPAGAAFGQTAVFAPERLEQIRQGLRDIYNLEYDRAAARFQRMIHDAPDDPAGYVYLSTTYWLQELGGKQELSIDRFAASDFFAETPRYVPHVEAPAEARFRKVTAQAIEKARARLASNPDDKAALFLLGLAYQNLASFEASLKRSWWSAFRWGTRTFHYHRALLRRDPNFHDARLSLGVYDYVAGSLGWSVKWLAFLMGYHGSKSRGKQELETAAEKALLVADDARVILVLIYTRERNYGKAFDYLAALLKKYPQNYLVHLDMGGIALLMKRPEVAIEIYQDILRKHETRERKYAELERAAIYNRLGVALREKGDLPTSRNWFAKGLGEPRLSERSATVAHLELGKTLDLMGRRDEARQQYQRVVAAADVAGSRREAERLLGRGYRR